METHKHTWSRQINHDRIRNLYSAGGTNVLTTMEPVEAVRVTVWWRCLCGANAAEPHIFRAPSQESAAPGS